MPVFLLWFLNMGTHNFKRLPVFGPKVEVYNEATGTIDTLDHRIAEFNFIDEHGRAFGSKDIDSTIYVAGFVFTRCPSICPRMTQQMARLQLKLDNEAFDEIKFLLHSVDPKHDSSEVLLAFAEKYHLQDDRTVLLTGDKSEIYTLGASSYLLAAQEDVSAPGGFLHSEKFVLVDRKGRIRGFYDGTNSEEVDRLGDEIKLLLKEEDIDAYNRRKAKSTD
ncbi:SCO family protein [Luteibaculum oceani]|nr:SCO family protein [Luteibaculum oceani]